METMILVMVLLCPPNKIYAVYNEQVKCIGFHEDAHILSYIINRPNCPAIREGLAVFFDRKWWGISNMDWCGYFMDAVYYHPISELLHQEIFYDLECFITYPIMGALTEYLFMAYGKQLYLEMYRKHDILSAVIEVYGKISEMMESEFADYVSLFRIDPGLGRGMDKIINEYFLN